MAWRLWPQLNGIFYKRESQEFIPTPVGGGTLSGNEEPDNVLPVSGGLELGGTAPYETAIAVSGGLTLGGSATRADIATVPVSGGLTTGGSAARTGVSTLTPSGGLELGGLAPVQQTFHYGWWPSDGFWPVSCGWWWGADWSYEQQGEDT